MRTVEDTIVRCLTRAQTRTAVAIFEIDSYRNTFFTRKFKLQRRFGRCIDPNEPIFVIVYAAHKHVLRNVITTYTYVVISRGLCSRPQTKGSVVNVVNVDFLEIIRLPCRCARTSVFAFFERYII